jgi:hypothetical protein
LPVRLWLRATFCGFLVAATDGCDVAADAVAFDGAAAVDDVVDDAELWGAAGAFAAAGAGAATPVETVRPSGAAPIAGPSVAARTFTRRGLPAMHVPSS